MRAKAAMQNAKNMDDVKISIEIRIEAVSEFSARRYAAKCGISASEGKWYPHRGTNGGKLYVSSSTPETRIAQALDANARLCAGSVPEKKIGTGPGT